MSRVSNPGLVRPHVGILTAGQRLWDALIIASVRYAAVFVHPEPWTTQDTIVTMTGVLSFWLCAEFNGVYRSWRGVPVREEVRAVLWSWLLVSVPMLFWAYGTKTAEEFSRAVNLGWFLGTGIVFVPARVAVRLLLRSLRASGRNTRTAVVIGATELGLKAARELQRPGMGMTLRGFYDGRSKHRVASVLGEHRMLGDIDDAIRDAHEGKIDFAYVALPLRAQKRIAKIVNAFADTTVNVQLLTDFTTFDLLHARWGQLGELPMVSVYDSPFTGAAGILKRIEDVVIGTLILLAAAPVMFVVAMAVKLTSPGPIFFVQTRYGLNGRPIRVIKFRTMTTMEDAGKVVQATQGDPRITKVGAFLRKTSLDELPQFFNVVRGDMSIVGPRPHAVAHNEQYRGLIHGYMLRHKVKPGITGWAQINGCRGETETVDKMRARIEYDLEYIERWNLIWDFEIIAKTGLMAWTDRNAY